MIWLADIPLRDWQIRYVAINHLTRGRCVSWNCVSAVTENCSGMNRYHNCTGRASGFEILCRRTSARKPRGQRSSQDSCDRLARRQSGPSVRRGQYSVIRSPMPRKKLKKHPKEMTDEEALKHLFHPKIVPGVKKHLKDQEAEAGKCQSRKQA